MGIIIILLYSVAFAAPAFADVALSAPASISVG